MTRPTEYIIDEMCNLSYRISYKCAAAEMSDCCRDNMTKLNYLKKDFHRLGAGIFGSLMNRIIPVVTRFSWTCSKLGDLMLNENKIEISIAYVVCGCVPHVHAVIG